VEGRSLLWKRLLAARLVPRYSKTVERLNWNARWVREIRAAESLPQFPSREEMYGYINKSLFEGGSAPVDFLEFGVFEGESLQTWCSLNVDPGSRFFGFDSFEGLPETWNTRRPKGAFDLGGRPPVVEDPRAELVVGWFQKTLPDFVADFVGHHPLVVHIDCDLYSSALFCLSSLNGLMPPGTTVVFDEFSDVVHEYRALIDFCSAFSRRYELIAATHGFVQAAVTLT
jgi:Methyltransferase domain